jgi:hypothetical protein
MNVLVNGTSISRGEQSWPYYLQSHFDYSLVNLAQAGSGNTYIHEATVAELSERPYDLVIIQWTYTDRFDFRVKDINKFYDSTYTSDYQCQQNDWPSKQIHPVNDQDYVQRDWIFGCGYINERIDNSIGQVFKGLHKHIGANEYMFSTLVKIISLQNTLKALSVPYLFMEYRPMIQLSRFDQLYKLIDWNNFYSGKHLFTIAKEHGALDDTLHPSAECQEIYASDLYNDLVKRKFINARL